MNRLVIAGLIAGAACIASAIVAWCAVRVGSEMERGVEQWEWMQ